MWGSRSQCRSADRACHSRCRIMQLFRASLAMQRCSAHRSGSGTAGVAPAQPYCSGTVRVAAAHLVLQWHSNDSARVFAAITAQAAANATFKTKHLAQLVLQRHSPRCSGTACVLQSILQRHSPCCSGAARAAALRPCCSGAARAAALQPVLQRYSPCCSCTAVLQWHSPCCSNTARVAVVPSVLQQYSLIS